MINESILNILSLLLSVPRRLRPQNSNLSIAREIMGLNEISDVPRLPNW